MGDSDDLPATGDHAAVVGPMPGAEDPDEFHAGLDADRVGPAAVAAAVEHGVTRTGLGRLQRRWVPAAPPVAALLLVHGINEHSGRYERVGRGLAERGIDVLSFDLRGHGGSGGRRGHIETFEHFLDDVEDLLAERRRFGVPVVLLGHSLGGLIATAYAESDRPQPDLLALSAPALTATVPRAMRLASSVLGRVAPRISVPNDFDPELLSRDDGVGRAYAEDPLRVRRSTARLGLELFTAMDRASGGLDRIRVPVWVVHGGHDRLVPPAASAGFEGLPDATRQVRPGLRHECFNEPEGDEVVADLATWILDRGAPGPDGSA